MLLAVTCSVLGSLSGAAEVTSVQRSEFDASAARATAQLPPRWRVAERTFGPQQITMHSGTRPLGLRLRLDGPQLRPPVPWIGPAPSEAQLRAHLQARPESIYIWVVPSSYRPQKDIFLADWFRPDNEQTHRLASSASLDLYAYGGFCHSWARWRSDLKRNFRK